MKVLVTGGAGHIGKVTTERLVRHGWEVRAIGIESGIELPGAEFVTCDIMDYDALREQIRGCQAVVHLAAIRAPSLALGHEVFRVNVAGTFNVFEAASAEGIRRVVQASSINAIGCAWSISDISPQYFPIDENHPQFTNDPYSYSKEVIESIGAYYWRRDGISSVAMRFPWVYEQDYPQSDAYRRRMEVGCKLMDELAALPEAEREARLDGARQRALEYRGRRALEYPAEARPPFDDDPLWYAYTFDRFNFWTFVNVLDAAQALEKALTADFEGSHALFINDHHNWLGYDSQTLVRLFFPNVREWKRPLSGSSALVSIEKARALIRFEPEYSVHGGNTHENR